MHYVRRRYDKLPHRPKTARHRTVLPTYKTLNRICITDVRKVRTGKVRTA